MIWAPFVLALLLGVAVSAGLYFAYLWPAVEPADPADPADLEHLDAPAAPAANAVPADEGPAA